MNVNGLSQAERSARIRDTWLDECTVSVDCVHPGCECEEVEVKIAFRTITVVPASCVLCGRTFDSAQQTELGDDAKAILAAFQDAYDPTVG